MLSDKSQVVSNALDGHVTDMKIQKVEKDDCVEEVKELKSKGQLNPIIVNKKKKENKIEDFFKKKQLLKDFVQRKKPTSKSRKRKGINYEEEDIEDSDVEDDEDEDQYIPAADKGANLNKTTIPLVTNHKGNSNTGSTTSESFKFEKNHDKKKSAFV